MNPQIIIERIKSLEADAKRLQINASLFLEKAATLKDELSGGSDSSILKTLSDDDRKRIISKRRKTQIG